MTLVRMSFAVPNAAGAPSPASGSLRFTPTARRIITGAPDTVVLPASFTVELVNGAADVTLEPTTAAWVWKVDEHLTGATARTIYVQVPAAAEADYTDLTPIDPATLLPTAEPEPAWVAMANSTVTSGTVTGDDLILTRTDGTTVNAGNVRGAAGGGSITFTTLTSAGQAITIPAGNVVGLALTQDATGGRTAAWPDGIRWDGGTVPALSTAAGATDVFTFIALTGGGWLGKRDGSHPAPADTTAPSAVTGLTAGTTTATTVPLSWTAATDNVGITSYEYSTNGTTYTATGSTGTTYTVTGLTASTTYTIYVRAYDAAGNKGAAASVTTTTAAAAATQVFLDTFTRPDGALSLNPVADSGQTWAGSTGGTLISAGRLDPPSDGVYVTHGAAAPTEGTADMTAPTAGSTIVSFRAPAQVVADGSLVNITADGKVSFGGGNLTPATITFNNNGTTFNGALEGYTAIPGFVAGGTYAAKMTWASSTVTVYIGGTRLLEGTYSAAQMTTLDTYRSIQAKGDDGAFIDNIKVMA